MDKTLRDYLKAGDAIHEYVEKFGIALKPADIEEKVVDLHKFIKTIQSVAKRLADVSNICNQMVLLNKNRVGTVKFNNPYPTENDHAVTRITDNKNKKCIVADISLPVKTVNKCANVPVSHIYYVKDIKQYVINIAGVNIRGNLANIKKYQTQNTARCEYGIQCKSFKSGQKCNYYHEPEDYIHMKLPVPDSPRNFTVGSWLYSKNKNPRAYFTRHIGSKDRLLHDLQMLKKVQYREEIANREGQLIHDLLIYMILHSKGLLERYPHWQNVK